MKIGDQVNYNGHLLDGKDHGDTTITRRIESGVVTNITADNWIEVTLESGMKVCMFETRMRTACRLKHSKSNFTIKHAPPTKQSEKTFNYLMYSQKLGDITDSPWQRASGSSLADARKKVGDDLVHDPGMPEMVLLPSEVQAGELRAEMMDEKYEGLVVTLVYKAIYTSSKGGIYVESLRHSQVIDRIHELRGQCTGSIKIMMVYSEETHQLFGWNDLPITEEPRMPKYDQEYERKRTAYRTPISGV